MIEGTAISGRQTGYMEKCLSIFEVCFLNTHKEVDNLERAVLLRAFEKEDISKLHKWMNDPESLQMTGRTPQSFETIVAYVEKNRRMEIT